MYTEVLSDFGSDAPACCDRQDRMRIEFRESELNTENAATLVRSVTCHSFQNAERAWSRLIIKFSNVLHY
jgi:hypothetical protein